MVVWAYLFEAKGIQRYLFMAGKLRDVVGASDLVARLASSNSEDLIGSVLLALKLGTNSRVTGEAGAVSFSRRAGGAFCLHGNRNDLRKVMALFRLAVMSALPGLEFSDALGSGESEIASQANAMSESGGPRANAAGTVLPLGRPVFEIVPTTGLPRISEINYGDKPILLDQIQLPLRLHGDALQTRMGAAIEKKRDGKPTEYVLDGVAKRFHGPIDVDANHLFAYPRNLSDVEDDGSHNPMFPWIDDYRLALVHADVSGLGEAFQNYKVATAAAKLEFGQRIESALTKAAQDANRTVLIANALCPDEDGMQLVPARPLVVGGDDMTFLVRADLALEFTAQLLLNIETETKKVEVGLSACAGVAIGNRGTPFLNLHELAESLCKFAKKTAKSVKKESGVPYPSLLAFHHQTQTAFEDYIHDVYPCMKIADYEDTSQTNAKLTLTANPFEVVATGGTKGTSQPTYDQLISLAKSIRDLGGATSAIRKIEGYLADANHTEAESRWFQLMTRPEQAAGAKDSLETMLDVLNKYSLKQNARAVIPFTKLGATPLFDALSVIDFGRLSAQTTNKENTDYTPSEIVKEIIDV
jgi:hypothetical protein